MRDIPRDAGAKSMTDDRETPPETPHHKPPRRITRLSWPNRAVLGLLAGVLAWTGLKVISVPLDQLRIDLASDRSVAGTLSYRGTFPSSGTRSQVILPEQVTPAAGEARDVTVTVTPLGKRNPKSQRSEVWLYEISSRYESLGATRWAQMRLPAPWVVNGTAALNAAGTPVPLGVPLKASGYVDVRLMAHPWSGLVDVSVGDRSRRIDLYAKPGRETAFRVLLPVPLQTPQRIGTAIPASANSFTVTFAGGPRLVRLERARLGGADPWRWNPSKMSDMKLGSGVSLVSEDASGTLVRIEGKTGSVTFPRIRTRSYWTPRWRDASVAVLVALITIAVLTQLIDDGRSDREQWSAVVSVAFVTVTYLRAAPGLGFGWRAGLLRRFYEGLVATGAPLVRTSGAGFAAGSGGDDRGLYLIGPYLAKWFELDVVGVASAFVSGLVVICGIVGLLGALRMCRSATARLYAGAVYAALGSQALSPNMGTYAVQFAIAAAFIPWLILALVKLDEAPRWSAMVLFLLGFVGAVANFMRNDAATATFIGAALLVMWANADRVRRLRLAGAMLLGGILVFAAISGVYAQRDAFFSASDDAYSRHASTEHRLWHQIYIGFGYTENPYVSEYLDGVAAARVAQVDSNATMYRHRYGDILRDAVRELVRDHPGFILRQLAVKAWVILGFLIFIGGVRLLFNLGLLGLMSRRMSGRLLTVFAVMLAFQSIFGLLAIPAPQYLLGFSTVAAILGIVAADAGLGDRPVAGIRSWAGFTRHIPERSTHPMTVRESRS